MKRLSLAFALVLCVLAAGCKSRGREVRHASHQGNQVLIDANHRHTKYCGHYMAGDRWFYTSRHRHGVGCGHVLEEGVWILR